MGLKILSRLKYMQVDNQSRSLVLLMFSLLLRSSEYIHLLRLVISGEFSEAKREILPSEVHKCIFFFSWNKEEIPQK
jgi:hypothetical protein